MVSFAISSCGREEEPQENPVVPVSGVSVNQNSLTIETGSTANLTATIAPSNATDRTVTWSSSNNSVATVSGGEASFEKFLEYDAVNRGKAQSSSRRTRSTVERQPLVPPVIVP